MTEYTSSNTVTDNDLSLSKRTDSDHSQVEPTQAEQTKTDSTWPLVCQLESRLISRGLWQTTQWDLTGFELTPNEQSQYVATLYLHRDERTDYRFNLSSQDPKLFFIAENPNEDTPLKIVCLTASQALASRYMDSDYLVLSTEMPLPVQAWMEAFIGRHGELLEIRRKKREGAGRSCGN